MIAETDLSPCRTLKFRQITDRSSKEFMKIEPLAEYLETKLKIYGIEKVDIILARNIQQRVQFLLKGKIEILTDTVLTALMFREWRHLGGIFSVKSNL